MGGAIAVPGNVTPAAEFNFHVDPEAAAAVFRSGLPLELVPLDATLQVMLRRADLAAALTRGRAPIARFIDDFTNHLFMFGEHRSGEEAFALHDPLAVGVALDPSLVGFDALHLDVEDEGRVTRGASVADRRPIAGRREAPAELPRGDEGRREAVPRPVPRADLRRAGGARRALGRDSPRHPARR